MVLAVAGTDMSLGVPVASSADLLQEAMPALCECVSRNSEPPHPRQSQGSGAARCALPRPGPGLFRQPWPTPGAHHAVGLMGSYEL